MRSNGMSSLSLLSIKYNNKYRAIKWLKAPIPPFSCILCKYQNVLDIYSCPNYILLDLKKIYKRNQHLAKFYWRLTFWSEYLRSKIHETLQLSNLFQSSILSFQRIFYQTICAHVCVQRTKKSKVQLSSSLSDTKIGTCYIYMPHKHFSIAIG